VSDVTVNEIDYAKPPAPGDGNVALSFSPEQGQRAVAAFGAEGEANGVEINFAPASVLTKDDGALGTAASPDGLLFNVIFGSEQLKNGGPAMAEAMAHTGMHIADLRENANSRTLFELEARAWSVTLLTAAGQKEKTFTAPGGYLLWSKDWSDGDRQKAIPGALSGFLADWAGLGR
jgi:hypothetical protein